MKRTVDLAVCLLLFPIAIPLIMVLAVLVRLTSRGPAILRQTRVGREGRLFVCYKLRTMRTGTRDTPTHMVNPGAVTPVGRYLRRSKLDELPQILNILRGEMSFVGPRPCLPSQKELIQFRRDLGVDRILPGITGVAQISGVDMSNPEKLAKLDATYLTDMTVKQDIKIILATAFGSGQGDQIRG